MTMMKSTCAGVICLAVLATVAMVVRAQDEGGEPLPMGAPAVVVLNQPTSATRLESMLNTRGTVIVRGYTDIGTVQAADGSGVSVTAVELSDTSRSQREHGLAIGIRQGGQTPVTVVTYLDADELDSLASALDILGRLDRTVTQLSGYEARFKSKADLEIANFTDESTRFLAVKGKQILPDNGQVLFATAYFPLPRLADLKQLITSARELLDKARNAHPDRP